MIVVYIAGPFRADNAWEIEQNVRRAEAVALECWRAGFAVICPHTMNRFFEGAAPDDVWLRGDMELLNRSDVVLALAENASSKGTTAELTWAALNGLPIAWSMADLILKSERGTIQPRVPEWQPIMPRRGDDLHVHHSAHAKPSGSRPVNEGSVP